SMISSVSTFSEIPNNFDYVMSQYDVVAIDKNGEPVTDGYSIDEVKQLFESRDTMIMVLDNGKIDDLTLAQYGYFTQDDFLEYAYRGVGDKKDKNKNNEQEEAPSELVGAKGIPYSEFVGKDAKMNFTYYPNDLVYTLVSVSTLTQDEISASLVESNFPKQQADMLAIAVVSKRNDSNEALKAYLETDIKAMLVASMSSASSFKPEQIEQIADMMVKNYYEKFRTHSLDEQEFIANAYTEEYKVPNSDTVLKAFKDKPEYNEDKNVELGVKLILEKKSDVSYGCLSSGFYYTNALSKYILDLEASSNAEDNIVKFIEKFGGLDSVALHQDYYYVITEENGRRHYVHDNVPERFAAIETGATGMSDIINSVTGAESDKLGAALFGGDDLPVGIKFYPLNFDAKNDVTKYLDKWNSMCESGKAVIKLQDGKYTFIENFDAASEIENYEIVKEQFEKSEWITLSDGSQVKLFTESMKITYTDAVGMIISMVNTMIQMITIALVAFTALSLVVSTVMIGIITYVSVVERVKEIGILRAVGARKKDIKRLFNAETFIIGLVAGLFGILITYLLSLIINIIVMSLAGIWGIAALPWWQALIMIAISVVLTLISGLIPASAAAKKDPVVALRTE
ncbi:MAG: ABC transporter permease, partial [Clostridia bacterium]|nr:ABC transporter permease [Clostridia bacterium]